MRHKGADAMAAPRNHYELLNVSPDAEPVVIEAAYRALMKKYHPDQAAAAVPAGAPTAAAINAAFATLRDPGRRAEYDRREWTKGQNVQLAAYQARPVPRVSRAFGWGGWVVASVLGGILAMIAGPAAEYNAARVQAERAAAAVEPDLRSQPTLPDEPLVPPAAAGAAAGSDAGALQAPASQPAIAAPAGEAAAMEELAAAPVPIATPRAQAQRAEPRRPAVRPRPRPRAEQKDFLEREGYIY
jgi:hypothetical protein